MLKQKAMDSFVFMVEAFNSPAQPRTAHPGVAALNYRRRVRLYCTRTPRRLSARQPRHLPNIEGPAKAQCQPQHHTALFR